MHALGYSTASGRKFGIKFFFSNVFASKLEDSFDLQEQNPLPDYIQVVCTSINFQNQILTTLKCPAGVSTFHTAKGEVRASKYVGMQIICTLQILTWRE